MKNKSNFGITLISNILSIAVSIFVSFFVTKYFVEYIGKTAYSFYPIANNFATYFSIFFVITNTASSRFVVIKYLNNDIEEARSYYSTIFVSCIILSLIIFLFELLFYFNLEKFLNIPVNLLFEVKMLFLLIFISSIVHGIGAAFNTVYYVKKRMDLSAVSVMAESITKAIFLIILFVIKKVSLVSLGAIILAATVVRYSFSAYYSFKYMNDIKIDFKYFSLLKLKKITKLGIWAIISNSGNLIIINSELILSNILVGVEASSTLSLVQSLYTVCLLLGNTISVMIEPLMIESVVKDNPKNIDKIKNTLIAVVFIPICLVMCLSKQLYSLWLPSEDCKTLFILSFLLNLQVLLSFITYLNSSSITTLLKEKAKGVGFLFTIVIYASLIILFNCTSEINNSKILYAGIISYFIYYVLYIPNISNYILEIENKKIRIHYIKDVLFVILVLFIDLLIGKLFPINNLVLFILMCLIGLVSNYTMMCLIYKVNAKEILNSLRNR